MVNGLTPTDSLRSGVVTTAVSDRLEDWQDIISSWMVPLVVQATAPREFHAEIKSRVLGDIFISEISTTDHSVERTRALIALGDKRYFKLSLQLEASCTVSQDGRSAVLLPGDMAIYDTDRPYSVTAEGDSKFITVTFPQNLIDLPLPVARELTGVRIAGDGGLAKIVGPFIANLVSNLGDLSLHSGVRLIHNALDLLGTVLYTQIDSETTDVQRSHRTALVQEIRTYIDEHLSDPDLAPDAIAAANFISTRHLHGIFGQQGVTVSAWIRARRLEHCRRELSDPLFADRPVSAIAVRWGFLDASHFSRLFRSTFGEAPTDFRKRFEAGELDLTFVAA